METSLSKSDEILLHYGKFFFAFEGICDVMRVAIIFLIFPHVNDKNSKQANILMEGLHADQLRAKFLALIVNEYTLDTEIYQLSKVISSCSRQDDSYSQFICTRKVRDREKRIFKRIDRQHAFVTTL